MLPIMPDYERTFPIQVQFGPATYTANLTVNISVWWHNFSDIEAGEPYDERPWHVTISLYLEGLPLTTWGGGLDAALDGEATEFETEGEAVKARERLIVKALSALRRAGYITTGASTEGETE